MLPVCCPVCNVGVLWPNGWMAQDTTWYGGRPQPRRHCVGWEPSSPHGKGHNSPPHFSANVVLAHVYCGQTVAHLSNCWALVQSVCANSFDYAYSISWQLFLTWWHLFPFSTTFQLYNLPRFNWQVLLSRLKQMGRKQRGTMQDH